MQTVVMASACIPHGVTRRFWVASCAAVVGIISVGCGSSAGSGPPSTLAPLAGAAETTAPSAVTLAPITVEPVPLSDLVLDVGGIGAMSFGDKAEDVIAYIGALLGAATEDTQWVNVDQAGLACPAQWHRAVSWGVMRLEFTAGEDRAVEENSDDHHDEASDGTPSETGPTRPGLWRGWEYGLDGRLGEEPQGLITPSGVALGARVDELRAAYGEVVLRAGEEGVFPPSFQTPGGLTGYTTGITDADVITVLQAGARCG